MRRGMVQVFRDSGDGVESPSVGAGWTRMRACSCGKGIDPPMSPDMDVPRARAQRKALCLLMPSWASMP